MLEYFTKTMTTLFQIILSKNKKRNESKNNEIIKYQDSLPLIDSMKNIDIIEKNVEITRYLLKQMFLENTNNNNNLEYCFSQQNTNENIDSKILYIHSDAPISEKLLLEDINIDEIDFEKENEYVKYYKIGENEPKDVVFRTAKENCENISILISLLDGIIAREDNILNGYLKQYSKYFDNEILFPALEHALLLNNNDNAKIISKYISKDSLFFDHDKEESIKYLISKNVENINIIENL